MDINREAVKIKYVIVFMVNILLIIKSIKIRNLTKYVEAEFFMKALAALLPTEVVILLNWH